MKIHGAGRKTTPTATKMNSPEITKGKYRHFKGNEYEVLFMARDSETAEDVVVYRALYGTGDIWVRPAGMWNETVTHNGKLVLRFQKIPD